MSKRILVIGDSAIDVYVNVDTKRLAPEGPWPAVVPHSVRDNPGMAANVAANIAALNPEVEVVTLFPKQPSVKTRYVDRKTNHHFLRVDQDADSVPLYIGDFSHVFDADMTRPFDAVILSDYNKGFLNQNNMETIATVCAVRGIPVFADTKAQLGSWSKHITFVKINDIEFKAHAQPPYGLCENLIVTRGGNGIDLLRADGGIEYHSPSVDAPVVDTAGAGDTALAALAVNYFETRDIKAAMDYANKACAVAVSKRGVVAIKREEIV